MKRRILSSLNLFLALILASVMSLVSVPVVRGAMITVPDDYPTIQQAVNAAASGDTVYVRAGTYYEHVTIGKALTLQGEDRETTIVDGSGSGVTLYVAADGVAISGFTVRNGSPYGIHLYQADNCSADDVLVTSNADIGMYLQASTYNTVTNSIASNNQSGFNTGDQGSHHNTFQSIEAYLNTASGFSGYAGSHYTHILDSDFHDSSAGVVIGWSNHWSVENTVVYSNAIGIIVDTADYGAIKNCEIHSNSNGIGFHGLGSEHNTVVDNRVFSNTQRGVYFYMQDRYNTVKENEIYNNGWGVYIYKHTQPSHSNVFYHNSFISNTVNAVVLQDGYANTWDNGYPSGGNYWDDYNGADVYSGPAQDQPGSDGIGDTPYEINVHNRDNYPLMRPWNTVQATVDIDPDTLNLKSKGKWVTAYIELPDGYDVADIDVGTVTLEAIIPAEAHPTEIGDYDNDGIPDLMVKFDRQALIEYLGGTTGEVTLTVSGELSDGTFFEGSDTITVINPGKK